MDASRFDAWTRRRFGLAAGGFAALLGLTGRTDLAAQKKKKKKNAKKKPCKKRGKICTPGGKRKCCQGLTCGTNEFVEPSRTRCCGFEGDPCADNRDCCGFLCCAPGLGCVSDCAQ